MKLAIHPDYHRYTDRWIQYCKENNIEYKIVNCHGSDIIEQLDGCDGLMWNWDQNNYRSALMAKQLTMSLEMSGRKIFPDYKTSWHFDDKVGQKYLLEAIDAPLIKTHVFYSKKDAEKWLDQTTFPKVFKLRNGAASINVKLVRSRQQAQHYVNKAFGSGFSQNNRWGRLKDKFWVLKRDKNFEAVKGIFKGLARLVIPTELAKFSQHEKGYAYFQDFAAGNNYDTRIHVIGNRCVALRRYVRENDFRASGSGVKDYDPELIDKRCIKIVFEVSKKLKLQSAAFDFIFVNGEPKIVEISYTSLVGPFYNDCPGYWDDNLQWHPATVNLEYFMIEDFIKTIQNKNS
jgi:glutathione synthase/RimK-type ligase-like ATP-grasp enzyme